MFVSLFLCHHREAEAKYLPLNVVLDRKNQLSMNRKMKISSRHLGSSKAEVSKYKEVR